VTARVLPLGQRERFTYDPNNNVESHTDFNGQTTQFRYDSSNRQVLKILPDATRVATTYTASGQVETQTTTRPNGQIAKIAYRYDTLDRLVQRTTPEGTITYTYDRNGNRASITTATGTTKYAYDELNRLASVTDPQGKQTTYEYDESGNKKRVSYPNNVTTLYAYDDNNRLTRITHQRTDDAQILADYRYTLKANGQREALAEYNSTQASTQDRPDRVSHWSYDDLQRLTEERVELRQPDGSLQLVRTTGFEYDKTGNRLKQREAKGQLSVTTSYVYDANDRLLSESTSDGAVTAYGYDDAGNTVRKSVNAVTGTMVTLYGYDADNRLISAKAGATEATAQVIALYEYDPDGNRVASTLADGTTTKYLVDVNQAHAQVLVENTMAGVAGTQVSYVYGDDLLSLTWDGQRSYYLYDGLGSTRVLSDDAGDATDRYAYTAFGSLEEQRGATSNSYLFAGEQYDPQLNLVNLRARWMAPGTGRFVSQDKYEGQRCQPISLNHYIYANANAANFVDPSGFVTLSEQQVATTVNASLRTGAQASFRVTFRKAGCFAVEALVGEAINAGIYIFLDGLTGLAYVGQTTVDFERRLTQHVQEEKRVVQQVMAKFHIDPKIQGETLRKLEQVIIDIFGTPGARKGKGTLSNDINAANKAKRKLMEGVSHLCK
jgi:RHS repeat-associated protein